MIETWTAKDWAEFDKTLDAHNYRDVPIEVDDPEGDPMGLSDVDEEGVDYDVSASEDERHQEEWRMKR